VCGFFLNATSDHPVMMTGHLESGNESTGDATLLARTMPLTHLTTREPLYGNGSIHFKSMRNTIADVLFVTAGSIEAVQRNEPPVAQECVLYWCVKTIRSSYDSGRYEEEILESHSNTTAGPFPWIGFPFVDEIGPGTDIFYMQDINIAGATSDGRNFSGFGTSNTTAFKTVQGFIDIFPSFTTMTTATSQNILRYKTWREGPAYNRQLEFNPWLTPNVAGHLDRLAVAMTNVIRSAPSRVEVRGEAFSKETYINVHWEWLAFPFALLLLSLIFLISTIVKTSKDVGVGVWKTSAMPTLVYGLPQDVQKEIMSSRTNGTESLKPARAAKVRIKLLPDNGWRVSGQSTTLLKTNVHRGLPGWV
jgi:hypothetical protein